MLKLTESINNQTKSRRPLKNTCHSKTCLTPISKSPTHVYNVLNFLVINEATTVLIAPMNKQTEIAFGPVTLGCVSSSPPSSRLLPGSRTANTIMDINVPTNCGSVV